MKKLTSIICLAFAVLMALALPVGAASAYQTYTYSINGTPMNSPDAYNASTVVDSIFMGLTDEAKVAKAYGDAWNDFDEEQRAERVTELSSPADIEVDENNNIYLADTKNNRIVVLDQYYQLKLIIETFINDVGVPDSLNAPKGVFITKSKIENGQVIPGRIFVCDTGNSRIITFNLDGSFESRIDQPRSSLIEVGASYQPVAVAVDQYDRLYVISSTANQGVMVMTDEGEFTGYIGAQKVVIGAWDRIWRRFQTDEQRAASATFTPTEFNNITLTGDFIYVTTSTIEDDDVQSSITSRSKSGDFAPVKMLNAAGSEIMRRNGFYPPSGEIFLSKNNNADEIYGVSKVVDVAVGPENTWSIIDQKRSKVFTYDYDGNLLFAFGDFGQQLGMITQNGLAGITYQEDKMILLDSVAESFTVYERTPYGNILISALQHQNERRYDLSMEDWTEILKRNTNFDTAYIGIGNALYRNGQYEAAIEYFQAAYDTANYSLAYKELRKDWISKFLILIPIGVIAICFACVKFLGYAKKVNKKVSVTKGKKTYWQELIYVFHLMFHPFDAFWDLKHEKRGSVRAGVTILGLTILAFYYKEIGSGYVMNPQEVYSTIVDVLLSVCVPLALFIISNWCLTTLFEGEGSFKDIFIACTYSLLPIVLIYIPVTIASNFVVATEVDILNL
ncbi:MAG: YIP1 family protein, partial [Clostridia bacterium]|nr:YIP1 family protein [Clostridia bacterium]